MSVISRATLAAAVLLTATLFTLALATCRGGLDEHDPRAVARAFWAASYRCDEEGVGRMHELALFPRETKRDLLAAERVRACKPQRVPPIEVFILRRSEDEAIVEVRVGEPPIRRLRSRLLSTEQGWRVDVGAGR